MKIATAEQYTPEWWSARRGIPTASKFSTFCTPVEGKYSQSKTAHGYMCELIASLYDPEYGIVEDFQTAAMRNGTILEPEARRFYEFDRGVKVEQVGLCITDDGRYGSSPDGLPGDGCLEIKSPIGKTQVDYLLAGVLPNAYKPQVHGHLLVTGRPWCDFLSYSPGLPELLVRVEPDAYTAKLGACLDQFCEELAEAISQIKAMVGPPPDTEPIDDTPLF